MRWNLYGSHVDIEILYVTACPHLDRARSRVREALAAVGVPASVRETEVATTDCAVRLGMCGSPTILIDGRDPFPTAEAGSLSCRLYRTDHALDGAPSVRQLIEAVKR